MSKDIRHWPEKKLNKISTLLLGFVWFLTICLVLLSDQGWTPLVITLLSIEVLAAVGSLVSGQLASVVRSQRRRAWFESL